MNAASLAVSHRCSVCGKSTIVNTRRRAKAEFPGTQDARGIVKPPFGWTTYAFEVQSRETGNVYHLVVSVCSEKCLSSFGRALPDRVEHEFRVLRRLAGEEPEKLAWWRRAARRIFRPRLSRVEGEATT